MNSIREDLNGIHIVDLADLSNHIISCEESKDLRLHLDIKSHWTFKSEGIIYELSDAVGGRELRTSEMMVSGDIRSP